MCKHDAEGKQRDKKPKRDSFLLNPEEAVELERDDMVVVTENNYTEAFDKCCPYYIAIGMTYEQYWDGSPCMVITFRRAHELRVRQRNEEMWMQGLYNMKAFRAVVEPIVLGFSKSCKTADPYPQYPIPLTDDERREEAERNRKNTIKWFMEGQQLIEK